MSKERLEKSKEFSSFRKAETPPHFYSFSIEISLKPLHSYIHTGVFTYISWLDFFSRCGHTQFYFYEEGEDKFASGWILTDAATD